MNRAPLKQQTIEELAKARKHLEYSYRKVKKLPLNGVLGEEELETFESFSSRFARFSDIAISKYFRTLALEKDPAFRGSVIDLLNQAEKYAWIESAAQWTRIRELRNMAAHDYTVQDIKRLYQELVDLAATLLQLSLSL